MVDLKRDLVRARTSRWLRVRTTDRDPSYLRIAVLEPLLRRRVELRGPGGPRRPAAARCARPTWTGVAADVERVEHDYEVEVTEEFESTWLPTQAPVSAVVAPGDWRYDRRHDGLHRRRRRPDHGRA